MNMIDFRGLNCYYNCLVNIASFLGIDYLASFSTLWSETDFVYDEFHNIYLTKRMITNLEALGAKIEVLNCSSKTVSEEALSLFQVGDWIIVGMDFFHITWHHYYQALHGYHYFSARKEKEDMFSCFDPIYGINHMEMKSKDISSYAFEIRRIVKIIETPLDIGVQREAQEIICNHSKIQNSFIAKLTGSIEKNHKDLALFVRYVDAMINNRYLYKHYLHNYPPFSNRYQEFFSDEYFLKWAAVKNGLYKASLIFHNENIINELCESFNSLINEEISMAKKIMGIIYIGITNKY